MQLGLLGRGVGPILQSCALSGAVIFRLGTLISICVKPCANMPIINCYVLFI